MAAPSTEDQRRELSEAIAEQKRTGAAKVVLVANSPGGMPTNRPVADALVEVYRVGDRITVAEFTE